MRLIKNEDAEKREIFDEKIDKFRKITDEVMTNFIKSEFINAENRNSQMFTDLIIVSFVYFDALNNIIKILIDDQFTDNFNNAGYKTFENGIGMLKETLEKKSNLLNKEDKK